jgi:hypothetical protein
MHKNTSGLVMECMICAAIGVGCGAFGAGLVWWQALLVCLGAFVAVNLLFVIFWIFAINKKMLEESAKRYAYTLITSIDSLKPKESKDQ